MTYENDAQFMTICDQITTRHITNKECHKITIGGIFCSLISN